MARGRGIAERVGSGKREGVGVGVGAAFPWASEKKIAPRLKANAKTK